MRLAASKLVYHFELSLGQYDFYLYLFHSLRTHYNVRELGSLIYDTVFSLKTPGSKELLLHQNVPASYLALEDVVGNICTYLKHVGSDPVLNYENFKQMVYQEMHYQNFKSFRSVNS